MSFDFKNLIFSFLKAIFRWIDDYSGKDFQDAVHEGIATLERKAQEEQLSVDRLNHLSHIFNRCCTLESNFWQMGLDKS